MTAVADDSTPTFASFRPNLTYCTQVRVIDAPPVFCSNDWLGGPLNFECRHMIDRRYWDAVSASLSRDFRIVDPTPPCTSVQGTNRDETVVGMLNRRLTITLYAGEIPGWVQVRLQNVLVVDALPVPIHVSISSLPDFKPRPPIEVNQWTRLAADIFPVEYRRHPYWGDGVNAMMGSLQTHGLEGTLEMTRGIQEDATGRRNKVKEGRACAACGLSECTLECSACQKEVYCSRECQQARWRIHREPCRSDTSNG